jgi:transcriptional regulator with GAF, ATPase, and Fis domain
LRDRKEDIPLLVEHFLEKQPPGRRQASLSPSAMKLLGGHDWPGNVRELRNVVTRLLLFPDFPEELLGCVGCASVVIDGTLERARSLVNLFHVERCEAASALPQALAV